MDYGTLIRQAWTITWRYRFLWLLGLLAGGAIGLPSFNGGGGSGWRADQRDIEQVSPTLAAFGQEVATWAALHVGLLVGLAMLGLVLMLVLLVLSFIAQGGMAQATADLGTGHTSSLRRAWGAGVHLFWRYVGLWLFLIAAGLVIAAVFGALVAAVAFVTFTGQAPGVGVGVAAAVAAAVIVGFVAIVLRVTRDARAPHWLIALGATLFALPIFTVVLVVSLTLSIVVAFAQRAIAVEDIGPIAALQSGWRLARAHVGASLLTWLVNLGLALATGITFALGLVGTLIVLGGIGALVFAVAGLTAPTIAYISLGGLVLFVGILTLAGIANAFFWTFWTLAYLRLSGHTAPSPAA
ncbi:MAG TPA: hypothetical protein VKV73_21875 [Chloroflexota bacterium]|nr:hypothetical protein [Chloroflexota bacterium]